MPIQKKSFPLWLRNWQTQQKFDAIQAGALEMADVMTCGLIRQFCL